MVSTLSRYFHVLLHRGWGGDCHVKVLGGENGEKKEKHSRDGFTRIIYVDIDTLLHIFSTVSRKEFLYSYGFPDRNYDGCESEVII